MKLSLSHFLLLLVISLTSCSQQTKKIIEESGENNSIEKKIYHVIKDDPTIKHGSYRQYWNGDLATTGFYKMGRKDSVWKRYDSRGSVVSKKTYTENK
jgi:antitoxin component YwqK of YwqJK toxin-antitoxin module